MNKSILKSIFYLILGILAGFVITFSIKHAAENSANSEYYIDHYIKLEKLDRYDNKVLYVDRNTGVMYIRMNNAMTVILNADGTPKLYEGDR